jgi:hypothetical protein
MAADVIPFASSAYAPELLRDPALIDRIARVMVERTFTGDTTPALIAYVGLTSRLLSRPLCLSFVAPSGAGKSEAVKAALALVPEAAIVPIVASSGRAFIYMERENENYYRNKILVVSEADSIPDSGPAASALRSLISDGRMDYSVTEGTDQGFRSVRICKNGPTGFITTGLHSLPEQLSTRMLEIVNVSDTPEQTRAIFKAINRRARLESGIGSVDVSAFIAAQQWLQDHGTRTVVIPFDDGLAELIPAQELRTRRDYGQLLTTIQTIALLHQYQRERTESGAVIATLDDYAIARRLLASIFDAVMVEGITPAVRATIEAVGPGESLDLAVLMRRLKRRSKGAISTHVKKGIAEGYLRNLEGRSGVPAIIVRTTLPLPDDASGLPTVEQIRVAMLRRTV